MALFGEKLRLLRRQHGMTQLELTSVLELKARSHLSKLESGQRSPSLALVVRLANLFEVSTDYLLRDSVPIEPVVLSTNPTAAEVASIGPNLKKYRVAAHLSQSALAGQVQVSRPFLVNIEMGRKEPSIEVTVRLADSFGIQTDELVRPGF